MSKFTDPRMEAHVEGFAEKPVHKFGASAIAEQVADLETRVAAIEKWLSEPAPKPAPEPPAPSE